MADMSGRIEQMMRTAEEQAQKASELQDAVRDVRGTATSADHSVSVTVAPSGAVLDLQLSPQVSRQTHTVIQRTIMSAIRDAQQRASEELNHAASSILGGQSGQFQHILDAATGKSGSAGGSLDPQHATELDDEGDAQHDSYLR